MTKAHSFLESVDDLLRRIEERRQKIASGMGETSHISEKVDDRTHDQPEGERFREHSQDIKEQVGPPSVDKEDKLETKSQDEVQSNIGNRQRFTGEDPSVEDDYKDTKDDPGSNHPARTDNKSLDGKKYASDVSALAETQNLIKQAKVLHEEILVDIAASLPFGSGPQLLATGLLGDKAAEKLQQKTAMCEKCEKDPCECKEHKDDSGEEKDAGDKNLTDAEKLAAVKEASQVAINDLSQTILESMLLADKTAAFLVERALEVQEQLAKQQEANKNQTTKKASADKKQVDKLLALLKEAMDEGADEPADEVEEVSGESDSPEDLAQLDQLLEDLNAEEVEGEADALSPEEAEALQQIVDELVAAEGLAEDEAASAEDVPVEDVGGEEVLAEMLAANPKMAASILTSILSDDADRTTKDTDAEKNAKLQHYAEIAKVLDELQAYSNR